MGGEQVYLYDVNHPNPKLVDSAPFRDFMELQKSDDATHPPRNGVKHTPKMAVGASGEVANGCRRHIPHKPVEPLTPQAESIKAAVLLRTPREMNFYR